MAASTPTTFAALLAQCQPDVPARAELRRQLRRALLPLAGVLAGVLAWSAGAPLAGAVVAPAQLKVELNRKTVQHQEGGIVREILVRDGQQVRAGEPLLVVGDVRSDAAWSLLQDQLRAEQLRRARAAAEAALATRFDPPSDSEASEHRARELALFAARRRTLDEQVASLQAQIKEARAQTVALDTQVAATEKAAQFAAEELAINEQLVASGFIQRTRLLALQRDSATFGARIGEHRGERAAALQRVAELQARIALVRSQYQGQAAEELKEASARVRELEERARPSGDQVERQFVRSPVDGEVMGLRVSAVGAAIGPREPLLDVVPARENLVVEARIRPEDIVHVRKDSAAEVRLSAFDSTTTPPLPGRVVFVSPDRVSRPDGGEAWFVATVEVDPAGLKTHPEIRLHAGMPAELFVTTPERSLLAYLAKPLSAFARRALREP